MSPVFPPLLLLDVRTENMAEYSAANDALQVISLSSNYTSQDIKIPHN